MHVMIRSTVQQPPPPGLSAPGRPAEVHGRPACADRGLARRGRLRQDVLHDGGRAQSGAALPRAARRESDRATQQHCQIAFEEWCAGPDDALGRPIEQGAIPPAVKKATFIK